MKDNLTPAQYEMYKLNPDLFIERLAIKVFDARYNLEHAKNSVKKEFQELYGVKCEN